MKNNLLDILFKLGAIILIFICSPVYLIWKYRKTETIEITTDSMPIIITIAVSIFVLFIISYIFSQLMSAIKDSPFGYGSIFFFGILILGVSIIGLIWIDKINDLVEYNVARFLSDLAIYKHSIWIVFVYIVSGLCVATAGYVYKKTR